MMMSQSKVKATVDILELKFSRISSGNFASPQVGHGKFRLKTYDEQIDTDTLGNAIVKIWFSENQVVVRIFISSENSLSFIVLSDAEWATNKFTRKVLLKMLIFLDAPSPQHKVANR